MKLEAQTLAKIKSRINEKVMSCHGTWIDWQYLLDAAALLAKCRYTLQYTYPYAYYMEPSPRKELVSFVHHHHCFTNCISILILCCSSVSFVQALLIKGHLRLHSYLSEQFYVNIFSKG